MTWRRIVIWVVAIMTVAGVMPLAALAQTGITWNGEYYNNAILQGPPALTRQESAVAFDWGNGSPGAMIPADNFSVRWGTDPFFQAGTYRFWALADDKVRVTIDFAFQPLIDTFSSSSVGQVVSADIALSQGVHHIQIDYQEAGGNAYVYVTWANLATNPTGPSFPPLNSSNPFPSSGPWTAQYFANPALTGTPSLIQSEASPSHNWGNGSPVGSIPADNFSGRWTSVQTLPAGQYQLRVRADDGVRVAINGIYYLNEWHSATGQTYSVNVYLNAGQHSFLVEYYEGGGDAFLDFNFVPATVVTATPSFTGGTITVTGAFRLNVRQTPNPVTGQILTKINRNETYAIVGRNQNSSWWQINVNGIIGWVNASYVTATNAFNVPVTYPSASNPTPTVITNCSTAPAPRLVSGRFGRVTPGLPNNVRAQPTTTSALVTSMPPGSVFSVMSGPQCAEGLYWYLVNFAGVTGWTPEGGSGQYWVEPL